MIVDGRDITWGTRLPEVERNVSAVSAYRGVRAALSQQQRRIGLRGNVVMVGRDIGTVVLPEADLKIYLVATAENAPADVTSEILARGEKADYQEILAKVIERDQFEFDRDVGPSKRAKDAVLLGLGQVER